MCCWHVLGGKGVRGGRVTAFPAAGPGAEALVVVLEAASAAPAGCGHGADCCAGSVWLLWTFCLLHDLGPLRLNLRQGGLLC